MKQKEFFFIAEKAADQDGRRVITAVVSSEVVDRDGEIVTAAAMKAAMAEYMKNPVILAGHCHRLDDGTSPVVGRVIDWKMEGKKTVCDIEFADTELGIEYWILYSGKFQRAFSIGFRVLASEEKFINGKMIHVITSIALYEISAVAIPANQDALSKSARRRRDFVESKRGALPESLADIFDSGDDDFDDEGDEKGLDWDRIDPFTMEPLPECPQKGLYSESDTGQGDSFSGTGGQPGADSARKALAVFSASYPQDLIKAFGSEKSYRRFLEFLACKCNGLNPHDCGFTLDEVGLFGKAEAVGIDSIVRMGLEAQAGESYEKIFSR